MIIYMRDALFLRFFFRDMPFDTGFCVFAGLERIIDYMENLRFTDTDIAYLREETAFEEEFIDYLKNLRFTGTIRSVVEGEFVFKTEPIIQVEANLAEAQLIETALLNIVNFQTLIATKAARIKNVVEGEPLAEFGTRRAQEMDAALWGARAAYIGGCDSTSNIRAGKTFGIPISGTMAHSMVQAYRDEYNAFKRYAETHKDSIFLVDTYDTLKSGIPNAIKVAQEMGDAINFIGIRLDSGDMAFLSKKARQMLDEAGFPDAKIFASSDLDETTILHLKAQKAKIDAWGVGTKLITAYDQPALGAVYKLVAIADENDVLQDSIKLSSNTEKVTTPAKKKSLSHHHKRRRTKSRRRLHLLGKRVIGRRRHTNDVPPNPHLHHKRSHEFHRKRIIGSNLRKRGISISKTNFRTNAQIQRRKFNLAVG